MFSVRFLDRSELEEDHLKSRFKNHRDVDDFPIGSVWAYSNNPALLWPHRTPDSVFVITEIRELETDIPLVFCLIVDDLNERSMNVGRVCPFGLGSAMAYNSVRIE